MRLSKPTTSSGLTDADLNAFKGEDRLRSGLPVASQLTAGDCNYNRGQNGACYRTCTQDGSIISMEAVNSLKCGL